MPQDRSIFGDTMGLNSQNGEDGVIEALLERFGGEGDKYCVEFGVEDGTELNTRVLWERRGWRCLLLDAGHENLTLHPNASLHKAFVTRDNIADLLSRHGVPEGLGLLSVDIDFNDFWVLGAALRRFRPRIVVAEVNRNLPRGEALTVPWRADMHWTGSAARGFPHGTCYYGMSLKALDLLADYHGYKLLYVCNAAINAILVRRDLLSEELASLPYDAVVPDQLPGLHSLYDGAHEWVRVELSNRSSYDGAQSGGSKMDAEEWRRRRRQRGLRYRPVWLHVRDRLDGRVAFVTGSDMVWPVREFLEESSNQIN